MMSLNHTEDAIVAFRQKMFREVDAIYDPAKYPDAQALKQLLDEENVVLLKFQAHCAEEGRTAALKGLAGDGVPYPEILWARRIGPKLQLPKLTSLRSNVPEEKVLKGSTADTRSKTSPGLRPLLGSTLSVGGLGLSACALNTPPAKLLLLALGIVMTASGVVIILKKPAVKTPGTAIPESEEDKIRQLLTTQRQTVKEAISKWISKLMSLIETAVREDREEKKG